jgi:hypothetical protein
MISGMSTIHRRKAAIRAIGVTVAAAALTLGCSVKSSNAAAPPRIDATTPSPPAAVSTAEQALARWIGAVVSSDFMQACAVMADAAEVPPKVFSPETCAGENETTKGMHTFLDDLHTTFTPDNAANPPEVEVAGPAAIGDSAKITAGKVSVDGKNLDDIVLSHSTGVQPGQTKITFTLRKVKEGWYVTNFDLKF